MNRLAILSLVENPGFSMAAFVRLLKNFKLMILCKAGLNPAGECSARPDPGILNCRVQLVKEQTDAFVTDVFNVEFFGSIYAAGHTGQTTLQILLADVTDAVYKARSVHSCVKTWQLQNSPVFCYQTQLGRLTGQKTVLSDWVSVARLQANWMKFPRRGKRKLQFSTSIISGETGSELACAQCTFTYENPAFGYLDLQENIERIKPMAVTLAFAVAAVDNKLDDCEVEVIKNWARCNIDFSTSAKKADRRFNKAFKQAIAFLQQGNRFDAAKICRQFVEIAPIADRYEILELCLRVAGADGIASAEELTLLEKLAEELEVDRGKFRAMLERILPVSMHEVENLKVVLGLSPDMSRDEARQHLNKEYRKWNARVTNLDAKIRGQADQMLKLITTARSEY